VPKGITSHGGLLANISKTSAIQFPISKGFLMKRLIITAALFTALSLTACDDKIKVVNVPDPDPAGATGAVGKTGNDGAQGNQGAQDAEGNKGNTGASGDTTVIVAPPAAPDAPKQ
jgi:hypothetical protein